MCQTEQASAQNKGGHLSFSVARHVRENKFYERHCMKMENYSISRYPYFPCLHVIGSPDGKAMKSTAIFHVEGACCIPMSLQSSDKFWSVNPRRRIQGKCECYPSNSYLSSWIQPSKEARLCRSESRSQSSEHVRFSRIRLAYKSKEFDITGADMDSLKSSEGAGEVVFAEENLQNVSPWWEQFPKRWVIVLLCFAAFLLCNMDRVSYLLALSLSCQLILAVLPFI